MTSRVEDTIIWKRLDLPGHDFAQVISAQNGRILSGTAIFLFDDVNCCLNYAVLCNSFWETKKVQVTGVVGDKSVEIEIEVTTGKRWLLTGVEQPHIQGCLDIDLAFTPATNLLPIRRENLRVGETKRVAAAWLQFPQLTMAPLTQTYGRISTLKYRYTSGGGQFTADLTVRKSGLVTIYPQLWQEECII